MSSKPLEPAEAALFIRARLLLMLEPLELAGGTPISNRDLHSFSYFANILSPVWEVEPLEGSVLKASGGPYFSALQEQVEACVVDGLLKVAWLNPVTDNDGSSRIDAGYRLNVERAATVLTHLQLLPDEEIVREFLAELAFAFVEIATELRTSSATLDAAWSDPEISENRVVDFGEFVSPTTENPAWNVAQKFQEFTPKGVTLNRAEKLVMYMRLVQKRAAAHG